jgi:hypothetical protein
VTTPNPTTPSVPQGTPETLRALAHSIPELAPNVDLFDIFADAWEADREQHRLLVAAVDEDAGECLPECNSFGHADGCQYVDMAGTLIRLRRRLEDARPFVEAAAEEAFTGPEWATKAKAWLAPQGPGEEGT